MHYYLMFAHNSKFYCRPVQLAFHGTSYVDATQKICKDNNMYIASYIECIFKNMHDNIMFVLIFSR